MLVLSRYGWWIAGMLSLAVFLTLVGQVGILDPFQNTFLRATSPLERGLGSLFQPVSTVMSDAWSIDDLRQENNRLRQENEALRNQVVELQRSTAELDELRQAVGIIGESETNQYAAARVIARDGSPFTDRVRIDRGSDAGIEPGMVVLSASGSLVGTVTDVTANQAFIRLITDATSAVNAQVLESHILGSLKGTPRRSLVFELAQGNINIDDTIVTSGIGGNYPAGLPIGRVAEVSGTAQDISRRVVVEPNVRMSTLETVLVLTSFQGQRLELD